MCTHTGAGAALKPLSRILLNVDRRVLVLAGDAWVRILPALAGAKNRLHAAALLATHVRRRDAREAGMAEVQPLTKQDPGR